MSKTPQQMRDKMSKKAAKLTAKLKDKPADQQAETPALATNEEDTRIMKKATLIGLCMAAIVVLSGCATQPSRSQSQTTRLSDNAVQSVNNTLACGITLPPIPAEGYGTNAYAQLCGIVKLQAKTVGEKEGGSIGDTHTQNMMLETGGNETNSQEASPKTDVPIQAAWGGGSTGASGGGLTSSLVEKGKAWLSGTTTTTTTTKAATDTATAAACTGDACTPSVK